jgi:hypothetical protein
MLLMLLLVLVFMVVFDGCGYGMNESKCSLFVPEKDITEK